jgi:hypothetical protein
MRHIVFFFYFLFLHLPTLFAVTLRDVRIYPLQFIPRVVYMLFDNMVLCYIISFGVTQTIFYRINLRINENLRVDRFFRKSRKS